MKIIDRTRNGVTFLSADGFEAAGGVAHGVSTRLGGVSTGIYESMDLGTTRGDEPGHVRENYRRFFAAIGADADSIAMSNQIHSDLVRPVTCADVKRDLYDVEPYEVDGLVTDIPGVSLVVFGADCLPVLFYDPVRRVAAAAHAGWRGAAGGIVYKTVRRMQELFGTDPGDLRAAIGAAIGPCCFETDADVPQALEAALGAEAEPYITRRGPKWHVDLKGVNARWLEKAGVRQIDVSPDCTACHPELYWSHRRMGQARGAQIAMICL